MGAGVDPCEFTPQPLPDGPPFRFATVSRLIWSKGIDLMVEAISSLARDGHPVELHIHGVPDFGNPLPLDPQSWAEIPGVHYHGFSDGIAAVWGRYHVAIFTSRGGEGLPRALLEAAACGRPCVVTAVPGCMDFVRDGIEGYVVPLNSGPALKQAILKLVTSPEQLAEFGRRARERVLNTSTVHIIQARYAEIFDALIDEMQK
jgi:glycosyltransferase involved in cell wall biosynthesis